MTTGTRPALPLPPDAGFFVDPHPWYARLRESGPVHQLVLPDGATAWLVTRYADVRAALADPRLSVERLAATLLDDLAPAGRADLVAGYAGPLPVAVICDLLGVPEQDRPDFRSWTDDMITPPADDPKAAVRAVAALQAYLTGLRAACLPDGDDLLSVLVAARQEGEQLSADELTSAAFLILLAGYENTVHTVSTGVLMLLRRPDVAARLRADARLVPGYVEELLRLEPPSTLAIRRFPVTDVVIGGVRVPAGATVLLAVASTNRDPGRFTDPDSLDPQRPDNAHLSLGHGIHHCLGAQLARMEVEVAIATVLRRFPQLRLAVPVEQLRWRPSVRTRGLVELPVLF